jgi:hypothetical protein
MLNFRLKAKAENTDAKEKRVEAEADKPLVV